MDLSYRPQPLLPSPTPASCAPDADLGHNDTLLALQDLTGCGNAYAQDLMRQRTTDMEGVTSVPEVEGAPTQHDANPVLEKATGDISAPDTPAEEAPPAIGQSSTEAATAEFRTIYRTTSAAETDAWLAQLAARGAADPDLAALAADLRNWVDQKRAERAMRARSGTCEAEEERLSDDVVASEEEVCEEPTPEEEPGLWQQLGNALSDTWSGVVAWWEGERPEDAQRLVEECPTREDVRLDMPHYEQNTWYDADGEALGAETAQSNTAILTDYGIYGVYNTRTDAYSDYLRLPKDERGDTVTWYEGGERKSEQVPDDIKDMAPVKYIPGGASCLRTAKAMAAELGATPLSGSGVQDSHVQTLLTSDEDPLIDADGVPVTYNRGQHAGREVKTNAELGQERADQISQATGLSSAYIDAELAAGRPVVVGVSYTNRNGNRDQTTDHWMTIYGRQGDTYLYYDPAFGAEAGESAFQADPSQGGVLEGQNSGRTYAVANVALNSQSADQASATEAEQTWREAANTSNDVFAEGTPENKRLGW